MSTLNPRYAAVEMLFAENDGSDDLTRAKELGIHGDREFTIAVLAETVQMFWSMIPERDVPAYKAWIRAELSRLEGEADK